VHHLVDLLVLEAPDEVRLHLNGKLFLKVGILLCEKEAIWLGILVEATLLYAQLLLAAPLLHLHFQLLNVGIEAVELDGSLVGRMVNVLKKRRDT
jgi:hypothetical protein